MEKKAYRKTGRLSRGVALLLIVLLFCTACTRSKSEIRIVAPLSDSELFKIGDEVCSVPEAMILITAQKKVIEDVYGTKIWSVTADEQTGRTFEDQTKASLKEFLARMKCMKLMAATNHTLISEETKKEIQTCTDRYLEQLTDPEKEQLEITADDVQEMFLSYYYYNRLMEETTAGMKTEISDDDARIMQVECIYVKKTSEDQTKQLNEILKQARKKGQFAKTAKKYDEGGSVNRTLSRGELPESIDKQVFSMNDDQISDVLEAEDGYYIVHCVEDYDRKETATHKAELIKQLQEEHFSKEYDQFVSSLSAQFNDKAWKKIQLKEIPSLEKADFFEIYKKNVK